MNWEVLAAAVIAVAGWGVTHWLHIRAQKNLLRLQLLNQARVDINDRIRENQSNLMGLSALLLTADISWFDQESFADGATWQSRYEHLAKQIQKVHSSPSVLASLEDYDALFPAFRKLRRQIAEREKKLWTMTAELLAEVRIYITHGQNDIAALAKARRRLAPTSAFARDHGAVVLGDLLRLLQNEAIAEISGTEAERRDPTSGPITRTDREGNYYLQELEPPGESD